MDDWEEIKRLAADFQRTQTTDTLQRISERNCIDIVKKLTDLKLIDLIYTCDGREFITPSHLLKEIEDEVYVNGGRTHLHDLAATLNVDYQHVENSCKSLVSERPEDYNLILGQIIHSTYKSTLEKQIYDTMISTGQLSIADFAKTLDLPSEFLSTVVKQLLPRVMADFVVSQDERTYYTTDMMDRYKSIIAGTLTAISKPTNIASIMKKLDVPERLFTSIIDGLMKDGRVDAVVENRTYIPSVYAREQNEWIDKFYSSNSYVEYDLLLRKDIKQPKAFLKKRFPSGIQLKTCFVSPLLATQVESLIEDCIATMGMIDISSILPPSIQAEDIDQLLHDIFKKNKQFGTSCLIINQTNVCSLGYIATCKETLIGMMETKAQEHLREGRLVNHFLGGQLKVQKKSPADKDHQEKDEQSEDTANTSTKTGQIGDDNAANSVNKQEAQDVELTTEDIKREKRQKKGSKGADSNAVQEVHDSEDELSGKKAKGSRKSGGGAQGREIKQKSVKKKYNPGNKGQRNNNDSDDENQASSSKAPRSNKGRAARRGASPDSTLQAPPKAGGSNKKTPVSTEKKEQLVFLNSKDLVDKLKEQSRDAGDFPDGLFKSIANMLENDLNATYISVAQRVLDDYMKSLAEDDEETVLVEEDTQIDLVE